MNLQSHKKRIEDYNNSTTPTKYSHTIYFCYYDDLGEYKINGFYFYRNHLYDEQAAVKAFDMIKELDLDTPTINDNLVVIEYLDVEIDGSRQMFIAVTDEQLNQIIELYDEINQK